MNQANGTAELQSPAPRIITDHEQNAQNARQHTRKTYDHPQPPKPGTHPFSSRSWPQRPRSPGLKWHKGYDTSESRKSGRVLLIDYVKASETKEGMRKVATQEIKSVDELRRIYSNPDRGSEAVLRVLHVQNANWAVHFLLKKFNIQDRDDLVGTDFGRYVKYKRPERRGGKPFLSGKSWKTVHDPWRAINRTSFGLDYLKPYQSRVSEPQGRQDKTGKMMELNSYDENDNPTYGWDVYVQRLSVYIQHKETPAEVPGYPDVQNPYEREMRYHDPQEYFPRLESLDNGNTIIIFENSCSGSIDDTVIAARQQWESRWRRLPFYLAYESSDISNDDHMALECMKIILQDVWKSVAESWEHLLDLCTNHVDILQDKIYEQPADESRAPELWANSSLWLKVERLVSIHTDVVRDMQNNLRELTSEPDVEDNWLEDTPNDMDRISSLVQEDLVRPTDSLNDLLYKSVEIRDSRHSLQLNTSLWRLSWITFIFLPLTFIVGFFGMNVDIFSNDPSVKWYFVSAVPLMLLVLILWYTLKHALARRRQTPYQRGIYEHFFHELANSYPLLWTRSGPRDFIRPQGMMARLKWQLILQWNRPDKTIRSGSSDGETDDDDLGAWARCKRVLTRQWTSQLRATAPVRTSASSLEEGSSDRLGILGTGIGEMTEMLALPVTEHAENLPGGMLKLPLSPGAAARQNYVSPRRSSVERPTSKGSSAGRNSGVLVEEEALNWLQELGRRSHDFTERIGTSSRSDSRRESSAGLTPANEAGTRRISQDRG